MFFSGEREKVEVSAVDINVTMSGLDSLQKEIDEKFLPRVDKAVEAGLMHVASDMRASLKEHVQKEVYDKYKPKAYIRTGAMADDSSIDTDLRSGNRLILTYSFPTESDKPYYEDSDDVIRVIQEGTAYGTYLWDVHRTIPARPFWNDFVGEQLVEGQAQASFVEGMNAKDKSLNVVYTPTGIILDGEDSDDLNGLPEGKVIE